MTSKPDKNITRLILLRQKLFMWYFVDKPNLQIILYNTAQYKLKNI